MDSAQETKSTNEQDDPNLAGNGYKMSKKNAEISERLTAIEKEFSAIRQLLTNDSDNEEGSDSAMEYDSEPKLQTEKQIKATGKPAPFERAVANMANDINMLVLGQTGVGKSTWVNAIVNYLTSEDIYEAMANKPTVLIDAAFTVTDKDYKQQRIVMEATVNNGAATTNTITNNENLDAGQSATQDPVSYLIPTRDGKTFRIIDTPGIGDVRGVEQDRKNVDNILAHLRTVDRLHGICILLKPNESKLDLGFRFCLKELLTHLHKSASKNIVFCFTNTRSTFYRPGETMVTLEVLLTQLKAEQNVVINLSKDTIFCLDNESFRFLCAQQNGVEFTDSEIDNFAESWKISVSETNRMLARVERAAPHQVKDTTSLNEARRMIIHLTKPMADISRLIQTNIALQEDKREELAAVDYRDRDLATKLTLQQEDCQTKPLGYPRTVCTAAECCEYRSIANTNQKQKIFKTVCHDHCYLQNVETEICPNTKLQQCDAMGGTMNCQRCKCLWSKHMHITYEYEVKMINVNDSTIEDLKHGNIDARQAIEEVLQKIDNDIETLQEEEQEITKIGATFASFLKKNSISAYNDAYGDYVQQLINEEKTKISLGGDDAVMLRLQDSLAMYREEVKILDKAIVANNGKCTVDANDIKALQDKLFNLQMNGKKIQQIFNVNMAATGQSAKHFEQRVEINYKNRIKSAVGAGIKKAKDLIRGGAKSKTPQRDSGQESDREVRDHGRKPDKNAQRQQRRDRNDEDETNDLCKLYIGNLHYEIIDRELREQFSDFGRVIRLKIERDDDGYSKGYGFVEFSSPGVARNAMRCMNGKPIRKRPIKVEPFECCPPRNSKTNTRQNRCLLTDSEEDEFKPTAHQRNGRSRAVTEEHHSPQPLRRSSGSTMGYQQQRQRPPDFNDGYNPVQEPDDALARRVETLERELKQTRIQPPPNNAEINKNPKRATSANRVAKSHSDSLNSSSFEDVANSDLYGGNHVMKKRLQNELPKLKMIEAKLNAAYDDDADASIKNQLMDQHEEQRKLVERLKSMAGDTD